ncbi:MAG: radical SAM/Cys-rich domain protein [Proteobacteria bacterium]|jgi:radical SAM/Cys-rich protein|nr:radical SAM/Cys-rich domain protein [Pseudomonadota bacterium]
MNKIFELKPILSSSKSVPDFGPSFESVLKQNQQTLVRANPTELQLNLGKLCNQACHHCHVDAGPNRTELMTRETMQKILTWLNGTQIIQADLTGGAPELNPDFRWFVDQLVERDIAITSRCNLTVLFEPNQEDLAQWYAERKIRLVCSLPCYTQGNVDAQRGDGVFDKSIRGLQQLNKLGYGKANSELSLDLVYNPGGAFLPAPQAQLEQDYRDRLGADFNISFSSLLTITNIPLNRFAHALRRDGELESYQELLVDNFNSGTVEGLMCRHLINVDWTGLAYDCDFNQMLDLPMEGKPHRYLWDLDPATLQNTHIAVDRHCFGCTAGAGSSCGGALTD